jgi:polar amino acid transport system substrate-binding protein
MADGLRGAKVLDGRWGLEQLAIAIPKGREPGMAYLRTFVVAVQADGDVRRAVERAGLRGTIDAAQQ